MKLTHLQIIQIEIQIYCSLTTKLFVDFFINYMAIRRLLLSTKRWFFVLFRDVSDWGDLYIYIHQGLEP